MRHSGSEEGQVSQVIKSKFGYHIIQMMSRAGDDGSSSPYPEDPSDY
jgi:hypothetical protein